ncbi:hypothetical protein ASPZODRAFT_20522 [Penicilliopsis zonata CBS 506.65]|uniref:Uncharacterized protein n=1 Tax=Penicilliopsis zonata CBS 506.65 TaxID=1073090 RepID=A0A1L9S5G7_9EURO|nr:hypothetical protein ASPZODRAFT_20522 [Penicilliopsis zonata CBS 506.65]OJJ42406.1 hypothetical protein ASPZODRAFT_20522 [Penicilliopsis zonata CBS 506.65]
MSTVLVSGSSRGLGLELIKQFAALVPENGLVIAGARWRTAELEELIRSNQGRVGFVSLDVSDESSIIASVQEVKSLLGERPLDILINCAGVHSDTDGKVANMDDLMRQFSVNVLGTHHTIRSFLPLMATSTEKKIVTISSIYGSMTNARAVAFAPCPAYKISKAALNALTVQYALSYEDEGFIFFAVNPGWLQTEMGGEDADLTVPQGATAVVNIIRAADKSTNGKFKNIQVNGWEHKYNGSDLAW